MAGMMRTAGRRTTRGSAVLEFVLVAPVYLLLIMALLTAADFSLITVSAHNASRTRAWGPWVDADELSGVANDWDMQAAFGHFSARMKPSSEKVELTVLPYPSGGNLPPSVAKETGRQVAAMEHIRFSGAHSLPFVAGKDRLYGVAAPLSYENRLAMNDALGSNIAADKQDSQSESLLRIAATAMDGLVESVEDGHSLVPWMERRYASAGNDYRPPLGMGMGLVPMFSRHSVLRGAKPVTSSHRPPYGTTLAERHPNETIGLSAREALSVTRKPESLLLLGNRGAGIGRHYWENEYHQLIMLGLRSREISIQDRAISGAALDGSISWGLSQSSHAISIIEVPNPADSFKDDKILPKDEPFNENQFKEMILAGQYDALLVAKNKYADGSMSSEDFHGYFSNLLINTAQHFWPDDLAEFRQLAIEDYVDKLWTGTDESNERQYWEQWIDELIEQLQSGETPDWNPGTDNGSNPEDGNPMPSYIAEFMKYASDEEMMLKINDLLEKKGTDAYDEAMQNHFPEGPPGWLTLFLQNAELDNTP